MPKRSNIQPSGTNQSTTAGANVKITGQQQTGIVVQANLLTDSVNNLSNSVNNAERPIIVSDAMAAPNVLDTTVVANGEVPDNITRVTVQEDLERDLIMVQQLNVARMNWKAAERVATAGAFYVGSIFAANALAANLAGTIVPASATGGAILVGCGVYHCAKAIDPICNVIATQRRRSALQTELPVAQGLVQQAQSMVARVRQEENRQVTAVPQINR